MLKIRYNTLQVLRFGAALGVLLFHTGYYIQLQAGITNPVTVFLADPHFARGVYLFFAISGFVLTHNIQTTSIPKFLAFRFARIYPPFLFCALLTIVIKLVLFGGYQITEGFWASFTLLPAGEIGYPLGVEWSLIYEIFFCMVLALVSIPRSRRVLNGLVVLWIGAIILPAFFLPGGIATFFPTYNTIFFSSFNLSFIAGIIAYQVHEKLSAYRYAVLAVAIVAFVAQDFFPNALIGQMWMALAFGSLVAFAAILASRRDVGAKSPLVRLGDYTYGIYLVHVPAITILLPCVMLSVPSIPSYLLLLVVFVLALSLGALYGAAELRFYKRAKRVIDARLRFGLWNVPERSKVAR